MPNRVWTLKVTNAVTSYSHDAASPGAPMRCERETTIVLERGKTADAAIKKPGHASVAKERPIYRPIDLLVVAMILVGGAVLPQMDMIYPNALGVSNEDWMLIGFVMMFAALPIFAEGGKGRG